MPSNPPDEQSLLGRLTNIFGGSTSNLPKPDQDEEEGMARMSFLDHLEELRHRLLLIVYGMVGAFCFALIFRNQMWDVVRSPATVALQNLHVNPPELSQIAPMDVFQIIWMKLPLVVALFIASPWILYQVWAFIAPGLYKHERRWAVPFVTSSAGLFIVGGLFAYFVIFRFGLEFLLGLGLGHGIRPTVSVTEYFDLFVDVMLAVGIVFEIPVLLFLLTLIRVVNPRFLLKHSRYAIMIIVLLAAIITPTGDVFNLTLFATPMIVLFYVGVFASYLLILRREEKKFPWAKFITWVLVVLAIIAIISWVAAQYFGYRFVMHSPFLVR
jgi:sec-independent protein translocase protein TatC